MAAPITHATIIASRRPVKAGVRRGRVSAMASESVGGRDPLTAAVSNSCGTYQSSDLAYYSDNSNLRRSHADLSLQESRVQILAAMGDAVVAAHQNDHVHKKNPVLPECRVGVSKESFHIGHLLCTTCSPLRFSCLSLRFEDLEVVGFWQHKSPNDDQNWRARSKPEKASPAMCCRWDERAIEHCRQQVADRIALLEKSRQYTASIIWEILKRCRCSGSQKALSRLAHITQYIGARRTPMQIPYSALTPRSCERLLQNPDASSRTMNSTRLAIMMYFRPNLGRGMSACEASKTSPYGC